MRTSFRALPLMALVASMPAASAGLQAAPGETIVVTGSSPDDIRSEARSYIRDLGVAGSDRPVARWLDPICPRAVGVSKAHAAIIEKQIRGTARRVGAPVAREACTSNFNIIFTESAHSFVRLLADRRPGLFGQPGSSPVRELKQSRDPVRWWYNTEMRTSSGGREDSDTMPGAKVSTFGGAEGSMPGKSTTMVSNHYNASLISTQMVRAIYNATVVIDVAQAEGTLLKSIVDYATLVGLAEIDLGSTPSESVLSLFEPQAAHRALSHRDLAFLSGLYRISLDRHGRLQRGLLVREMARKMDSVPSN